MNTGGEIRCLHCDEPVTEVEPEQVRVLTRKGETLTRLIHGECHLRQIVGGVNHQRGTCTCCGGKDDPDPPGLSRHMAAYMASDYWHGRGLPLINEQDTWYYLRGIKKLFGNKGGA